MRKRRWLPEYKCEKVGMYILAKPKWCSEEGQCMNCQFNKGFKTDDDLALDEVRKIQHKKDLRIRRKQCKIESL